MRRLAFQRPIRRVASLRPMRDLTSLRPVRRLATALLTVGIMGLALAAGYEYGIEQNGVEVASTSFEIERSEAGYRTSSTLDIPGFMTAEARITAGPDGAAQQYEIEGTASGVRFTLTIAFTGEGADIDLEQGGTSQSLSIKSDAPIYVLENNFLEGYQLAVDQVMKTGLAATFGALVPLSVSPASLQLDAPEVGASGATVTGVVRAGPQAISIVIDLDEAGDIVTVEMEPGAARFVRREPTADGGPATSAQSAAEAAQAELQDALLQAEACLSEATVFIDSTGETLGGKLTLPVGASEARPAPVLLLLPGSGAVDMDGNSPPILAESIYQQLAYGLACNGYGVLRVAKLGLPPSTGDANAVTLATYSQNAADWLDYLAQRPDVAAGKLGLLGHSEGGLIALHATATGLAVPKVVALLASPGRTLDVILREQLTADLAASGLSEEDQAEYARGIDEAIEAIRDSTGQSLELTGELSDNSFAAMFASAAGLFRSEFEADPAELAESVGVPTAVLQGLADVQVRAVDARTLEAHLPHGTLLEFQGVGHDLRPVGPSVGADGVVRASKLISPTVLTALTTWLDGHLKPGR